jgi:glycosyltransferase involved in cell wall biosynthesis
MIAFFVLNLDTYSGSGQQALLLAKNIDQDVLIFNYNHKTAYKRYRLNDHIEIVDVPKSLLIATFIAFIYTLKYRIKIYHIHGGFINILLLGNLLGIKNILKTTLMGADDFDTLSKKKRWDVWSFSLRRLTKNVVLSNKVGEINAKYIDSNKIIKISNGVLVPGKCPTLDDKENSFCFVGLVCKRKRTLKSIQYFIDNYAIYPDTKLYIVGPYQGIDNSNEFSNEYVTECLNIVKQYDLIDRIIFTGGVSKEQTQAFFSKCKGLLFFSEKEGMPNVVLESLANNCVPIVNSMDGVAKEIFDDSVGGFILEDSKRKISIEMVENLIKSQGPYSTIQRSSIENIGKKYNQLYKELLGVSPK